MNGDGLARLRLIVAYTIVGAWVISIGLDAFVPAYEVPSTLHGLMMAVAAFLFGPSIVGRRSRNGGDPS